MSVPIPSKITDQVLDLDNLFSLIRILGDDASGGDVHGDSLAVMGEQCTGGAIQANDWRAPKIQLEGSKQRQHST